MRFSFVLAAAAFLAFEAGIAKPEITELKTVNGKRVVCQRTGLMSFRDNCGAHSDWYTYVFVGTISAIIPAAKDESQLQITPKEVFLGKPGAKITVLTSQGLCFPKFAVGDQWLFYLREVAGQPIVLDYYGNSSAPLEKAQDRVNTLRRLQTLGNLGLLRGRVAGRHVSPDARPIPAITVIARHESDGKRLITTADADGRFEFPPLSPGDYDIKFSKNGHVQSGDEQIELESGNCWGITLSQYPRAAISGRVSNSRRVPLPGIDVALIALDNSWYDIARTDEKGRFSFDGQYSGNYVLGVNFPNRHDWISPNGPGDRFKTPSASLFYPGVHQRNAARILRLKKDQSLDHIDFTLDTK